MVKKIKKLFLFTTLFNKKLIKSYYTLICLNVFFSFFEILNFLLLFPFFKLIFKPNDITNDLVLSFINESGLNKTILYYALFFILFSILRYLVSNYVLNKNKLFFIEFNMTITNDLIKKTINIPYNIFIKYNYTDFPRLIYNDINYFIIKGLNSFFLLVNELFLIFFILFYLFTLDIYFVSFLLTFLVFSLIIINRFHSNSLKNLVISREENLKHSLSELNEFYFANKEIRFLGLQSIAIPNLVKKLNNTFNNYEDIKLIEKKPRVLLESFLYVFIVLVTIIAFFFFNIETSIFSMIILGFLRMTPSASKINSLFNSFTSTFQVVDKLIFFRDKIPQLCISNVNDFSFKHIDSLELINYSVNHDGKSIFREVNIFAKKGDIISILGKSGSGKTSFFDSLFGYCNKSKFSKIIINNRFTIDNLNSTYVSYFPQNIYLMNKSLLFNLTLEEDENKIDFVYLKHLISIFMISNIIEKLDDGLYSICGFGGYAFSGGEKQRIGMVRSFYNKKDIIILDEFTSALDAYTETSIINNLIDFLKNINSIIFIISHNSLPHTLSNISITLNKEEYEN